MKPTVVGETAHADNSALTTNIENNPNQQRRVFINDDPEMQGLTLYEKKALLIDRELAAQGMGRYQWTIFFLCGCGYFIDLLWAQAVGLILASIQQEFGFSTVASGNLSTSFSAGLTIGAVVWGILVDIVGRYYAFNFTVLLAGVFGICLAASSTYNGVLVLTAFVGLGIGGNIPVDTTICLELLPQDRRWLLPALSVFQPLGVVICSAIAYGFIPNYSCATNLESCKNVRTGQPCCTKADNMGWRYTMVTLGAITIFVFIARFVLFRFRESPKYLLCRGKDEMAAESLEYIANYNTVACSVTLESFTEIEGDDSSPDSSDSESRILLRSGTKPQGPTFWERAKIELIRLRVLFGSLSMAWLTICVWIIYIFDYWGFTIAGTFLPIILRKKGASLGLTLDKTYLSYIYIYLPGIIGVLAGTTIYKWRRISMIISSALFGAMLFTFTAVHSQASYIGINALVYIYQSMFNAILYGVTPELFPTSIRGTAVGVASFWGRVSSIVAPLVAARFLAVNVNAVSYLAGAGVFVSTLFICLLPGRYLDGQDY